jgi:hypothetical protein
VACLMEMNLPPTFFDIQPYLIVHLPNELLMAGPVRPRWMYFVERHLRVLKSMVRQRARPESCIAEGQITQEAIKYAAEYCPDVDLKWASPWMEEDEPKLSGDVVPEAHVEKVMSNVLYEQAHRFVLLNHPSMAVWLERHEEAMQGTSNVAPFRHWVRGAILQAMQAGDYISQEVLDISVGPSAKAKFHAGKAKQNLHSFLSFK